MDTKSAHAKCLSSAEGCSSSIMYGCLRIGFNAATAPGSVNIELHTKEGNLTTSTTMLPAITSLKQMQTIHVFVKFATVQSILCCSFRSTCNGYLYKIAKQLLYMETVTSSQ